MNLKAFGSGLLALVLTAGLMTGCINKDKNNGTSSLPSSSLSSESSSEAGNGDTAPSGKLQDVRDAVAKAMGEEGYIANPMQYDETMLEEQFGLTKDLYKAAMAEAPMISVNAGLFVGVEAVEGKAEEVRKKLGDYRDKLNEDEMQYPMNRMKVKSAEIYSQGDYIFLVMLGAVTNESMDMEDADQLEYFKKENQKAIDAIKEALK